jgi:hypothetical protein
MMLNDSANVHGEVAFLLQRAVEVLLTLLSRMYIYMYV